MQTESPIEFYSTGDFFLPAAWTAAFRLVATRMVEAFARQGIPVSGRNNHPQHLRAAARR